MDIVDINSASLLPTGTVTTGTRLLLLVLGSLERSISIVPPRPKYNGVVGSSSSEAEVSPEEFARWRGLDAEEAMSEAMVEGEGTKAGEEEGEESSEGDSGSEDVSAPLASVQTTVVLLVSGMRTLYSAPVRRMSRDEPPAVEAFLTSLTRAWAL